MMTIYYTKQQRRSRRKFLIILLFLGLLITVLLLLIKIVIIKPASENILGEEDISPSEELSPYPTLPLSSPAPNNVIAPSEPLGQAIREALSGTHGSYGIVVKNLKTGENYSLNEHVSYQAASLYKLWIMAETYRQISNGTLKEDMILSEKYATLNARFNIDPENAEVKEGEIALSVKDALNKMITISDNYAGLLLALKIRLANIASFLKVNGFNESKIGTNGDLPTTTPHDIALFFEKLYNTKIINQEYSEKMLQLLKWQRLNDKLPKYLPENTTIAHKTGELDEYTHDAGITYAQNDDYIIVVLSKSDDPDAAKNRISNVSEAVYNYFKNNK